MDSRSKVGAGFRSRSGVKSGGKHLDPLAFESTTLKFLGNIPSQLQCGERIGRRVSFSHKARREQSI